MFTPVQAPLQQCIDFALTLSVAAPQRVRSLQRGMSGINKDLLKVHLTCFIIYNLTLTLFTYISRSTRKKREPERLE